MSLIVPKTMYANASTWSSSAWQMGSVIGPATGGFAILWVGVSATLFIVLLAALLAFVLLLTMQKKPVLNKKVGEPIMQSLKEGVRFVFKTKVILGALTLDMVAVLFGGALALLPIYATDILEVGPKGFGVLRAAPAVGSFLTILTIAYFPIYKKAGIKLLIAIAGFGLSIIVFGWSEWFFLSVIALFFSGVTDGISVVVRNTILQLYTPDDMRGRVASVNSMFVGSSNELGAFESGVTAKLFGPVRAVIGGGIMTILIVAYTGFKLPKLRKLEFTDQE
jgi:MFS family permease